MFLIFSVFTYIAISMAPADATEYTLFVKDTSFKVRRCSVDEWCTLDSVGETIITVSVTGHVLVLSTADGTSEFDVSGRIALPPELEWRTVETLSTGHEGVQLLFERTECVVTVTRNRDGEVTDFATITYGRPRSGEPPK